MAGDGVDIFINFQSDCRSFGFNIDGWLIMFIDYVSIYYIRSQVIQNLATLFVKSCNRFV